VTWGMKSRVVHWLYFATYHQAVRHFCILGMVAWLSDGQCQDETKQGPKISLLRDNGSYAHYSHQCCGGTHLPPPQDLVVQSEARSAAHRLWSLGCWYYLIRIEDTGVF